MRLGEGKRSARKPEAVCIWCGATEGQQPYCPARGADLPCRLQVPAPKVTAVERPYLLSFFHSNGGTFLLTSEECQRMLDTYPVHSAKANWVVLVGHNSSRAEDRATLRPATLGGGPAFIIER